MGGGHERVAFLGADSCCDPSRVADVSLLNVYQRMLMPFFVGVALEEIQNKPCINVEGGAIEAFVSAISSWKSSS